MAVSSALLRGKFARFEAGKRGGPKNNFLGQKARTAGAKLAAPPALGYAAVPIGRSAPRPHSRRAAWHVAALDKLFRSGRYPYSGEAAGLSTGSKRARVSEKAKTAHICSFRECQKIKARTSLA
jgi:hypothetical protein